MSTQTLHVQLLPHERTNAHLETITRAADVEVWRDAAEVLRARSYGSVRVRFDWDRSELRVDDPDAFSYGAFFFHEVFLLMNLAVPGSFGGTITLLGGGSEFALSARMFSYAWAAAPDALCVLPLRDVVAWYDALHLDAQQVAMSGAAKALFLLLHIARGDEDEAMAAVRLASALRALDVNVPVALLALQDGVVMHPLADEGLDDRVEDVSLALVDATDRAAAMVVRELQKRIQRASGAVS